MLDEKNKSRLYKSLVVIVFMIVLIGSMLLLSFVFTPTNNYPDAGMIDWNVKAILAEPQNSIDAIFLGNSEGYYAFTPLKIWEEQGITTYNCSAKGNPVNISESYLHLAFEKQTPKVVFFETDSIYKKPLVIWQLFSSRVVETFSVMSYHNRWKDMDASEIGKEKNYTYQDDFKGFFMDKATVAADPATNMNPTDKSKHIFYRNRQYIIRMKEYCEERGAKFVLVSTPTTKNWNMKKHNGMAEFAQSAGIEYIDMNFMYDELHIDWNTDSRDGGDHLNVTGADKICSYLGQYLANTGLFTDKRTDAQYSKWNENLEKYNNAKNPS